MIMVADPCHAADLAAEFLVVADEHDIYAAAGVSLWSAAALYGGRVRVDGPKWIAELGAKGGYHVGAYDSEEAAVAAVEAACRSARSDQMHVLRVYAERGDLAADEWLVEFALSDPVWPDPIVRVVRGRGRPAIGGQVKVSMPAEMVAELDRRAVVEGVSRSDLVRRFVEDGLAENVAGPVEETGAH